SAGDLKPDRDGRWPLQRYHPVELYLHQSGDLDLRHTRLLRAGQRRRRLGVDHAEPGAGFHGSPWVWGIGVVEEDAEGLTRSSTAAGPFQAITWFCPKTPWLRSPSSQGACSNRETL